MLVPGELDDHDDLDRDDYEYLDDDHDDQHGSDQE